MPLHESALRKKFNGSVPLENEDRMEIIKAELPGPSELSFLGLLENDESPGWANKELMKAHPEHTIISLLPMHKLNAAVAMAQSYIMQGSNQRVALLMNKERHFSTFRDTQAQLETDPVLKDWIMVVRDEAGATKKPYTTYDVRRLLNGKDKKVFNDLGAVEFASYKCHVSRTLKYKPASLTKPKLIPKALEDLEFSELTVLGDENFAS